MLRSAVGMTHDLRSDLWWTIYHFAFYLVNFGMPYGSHMIRPALARHTGFQVPVVPAKVITWSFFGTFHIQPTGIHGLCFGSCFSGPLPLRSLLHGPLSRVHFGESLVVRLYSEIDHIHLSSEAQCVSHLYPRHIVRELRHSILQYLYLVNNAINIRHIYATLKEKSWAETAPGWRRFHVHRMAHFWNSLRTVSIFWYLLKMKWLIPEP